MPRSPPLQSNAEEDALPPDISKALEDAVARALRQRSTGICGDGPDKHAQSFPPVQPTIAFSNDSAPAASAPVPQTKRGKKRKRNSQLDCDAPRDSAPAPLRSERRPKFSLPSQDRTQTKGEMEGTAVGQAEARAQIDMARVLENLSKAAQQRCASEAKAVAATFQDRERVARPRPRIGKLAGGERQRRALQRRMRAGKVSEESVHCEAGDTPHAAVDRDGFLVVFKPPGWTATTTSNRGDQRTKIQNWLLPEYGERHPYLLEDPVQAGIVHRLDIQTSGPMVVATREDSYNALCASLARQLWYKEYVTLIHGALPRTQSSGKLEYRLQVPKPRGARIWRTEVNNSGLQAETWYQAIRCYKRTLEGPQKQTRFYTLLRVRLITGRTHQIRVHFRELCRRLNFDVCGIVGDHIYLPRNRLCEDVQFCPRIFLHERKLEFPNPDSDKGPIHVVCPLPRDLRGALQRLDVDDSPEHAGASMRLEDAGLLGGDGDGHRSLAANAAMNLGADGCSGED